MHDITNRYQVFPWIKQPGCGVITHPRRALRMQMSLSPTSTCLLCLHRNVVGCLTCFWQSDVYTFTQLCDTRYTADQHALAVMNGCYRHHGRKLHCIVTHPVHLALLAEHFVTKLVWWPQFPFMSSAVLCVTFCVHKYEVCAESSELQVQLPFKIVWWPHENWVWFSRQSGSCCFPFCPNMFCCWVTFIYRVSVPKILHHSWSLLHHAWLFKFLVHDSQNKLCKFKF
jgi:hypothetical protein